MRVCLALRGGWQAGLALLAHALQNAPPLFKFWRRPQVEELANPALRARHWAEVFELIGADVELNDAGTGARGAEKGRGVHVPLACRVHVRMKICGCAGTQGRPRRCSYTTAAATLIFANGAPPPRAPTTRPVQATRRSASTTCCSSTCSATSSVCRPSAQRCGASGPAPVAGLQVLARPSEPARPHTTLVALRPEPLRAPHRTISKCVQTRPQAAARPRPSSILRAARPPRRPASRRRSQR